MLQTPHVSADMKKAVTNAQLLKCISRVKDSQGWSEAQPTIRPVFEKTLTDSAPKYFKRSSFSSCLSSAGKCRIRSVLQPFVWTTSSFLSISLQNSEMPQTKHGNKDFRPPTTSQEHYAGFCWLLILYQRVASDLKLACCWYCEVIQLMNEMRTIL